jgi:hypothetical protein
MVLCMVMHFVKQVGAGAWAYLSVYAHSPRETAAALIMANLGVAVSDVVADSLVVEKVRVQCYFA